MSQQMALGCGIPRPARQSVSPLRVGLWLAGVAIAVRAVGGSFANDWEGWGTALQHASVALVSGGVLVALTFGILVRWGLRTQPERRNRPARTAVPVGAVAVLSFAVFFTGAPAILGAGAITLGLAGLRLARQGTRGRIPAIAGLALGTVSFVSTLGLYATEIASGVQAHWV